MPQSTGTMTVSELRRAAARARLSCAYLNLLTNRLCHITATTILTIFRHVLCKSLAFLLSSIEQLRTYSYIAQFVTKIVVLALEWHINDISSFNLLSTHKLSQFSGIHNVLFTKIYNSLHPIIDIMAYPSTFGWLFLFSCGYLFKLCINS
jgi:hypothetical protein